jgi:hypothetical protein
MVETKDIIVVGLFTYMMTIELSNRGFTVRDRELLRHEEAAKLALRHLSCVLTQRF